MNARTTCVLALLGLFASCASPEPTYYRLTEVAGAPVRSAAAKGPILVRQVMLAGYLDRAEIVRSQGDRLLISPSEQWGEPLGDVVNRVLTSDLAKRMSGRTVVQGGRLDVDADTVVEVDMRRFDAEPETVTLAAEIAIQEGHPRRLKATKSIAVREPIANASTGAVVDAMSQALGKAADQIAELVAAR